MTRRRRHHVATLVGVLLIGFSGPASATPPATDIPGDGAKIIDLAALRFATDLLVTIDDAGERRFLAPDAEPFPAELIREPFAGMASDSDLFIVQATAPRLQVVLRETLEELGARVLGYVPNLIAGQHRSQPTLRVNESIRIEIQQRYDYLFPFVA